MSNSGDGFTSAEVETILRPSIEKFLNTNRRLHRNGHWEFKPRTKENHISRPNCKSLRKKPQDAEKCMKCIVKNDSGAVTVCRFSFLLILKHRDRFVLMVVWT